FAKIVGLEWDDGNSRKSADKHSVSQSEAEQIFLEPRLLVLIDDRHGGSENRFTAYGRTLEGRRLHVTFSTRRDETLIRVISARAMSRKERARYDQEA
ncbi:MAG: BrnT family toxin, partial [Rhodoplanes sp.]